MIWGPLTAGPLMGERSREGSAEDGRQRAGWTEPPVHGWNRPRPIVDVPREVAEGRGAPATQRAPAWLPRRPAVATPMAGG